VLDAEAPHLTESAALIAALRRHVAGMRRAESRAAKSHEPPAFAPVRAAAVG
jgi:hypothetical protein